MEKNEKIQLSAVVILVLCCTLWFVTAASSAPFVVREKGKVYIVDQTGERWDVTQAESIGYKPEKFQYGMGRNFFTALDDSLLRDKAGNGNSRLRVIGIAEGSDAKAYSVPKLSRHEVANSKIGEKPVAVGYWPLADLAAVYSRELDGKTLTITPSGWTYKNVFVLSDKETGTLWYPNRKGLKGIQGEYFERLLPKISSKDTQLKKWLKKYPDSKILK